MNDNRQPPASAASERINIVAIWEVNYWSTRWGITPDQLFAAIAEVGDSVRAVQQHLARRQHDALQDTAGYC